MHSFVIRVFFLSLVICVLGSPIFAQKKSTSGKAAARHPEISNSQECSDCHSEEFSQWKSSKHGQGLVKCSVCHGAVGSNFIPKPGISRCQPCHGEAVKHLNEVAVTRGKTCFACHSPHLLNPHVMQAGGTK